jgi:hypothetical protein
VLFANAPKTWVWDITEMLGGLSCTIAYFLGVCQMMLSEKSSKSLKLSAFISYYLDLNLFGRFTLKCKRGLRNYFEASKLYPS